MRDEEWHGWRVGSQTLHVGRLPGRKQVALYEVREHSPRGSSIHPLAYFKAEKDARTALAFLDRLAAV